LLNEVLWAFCLKTEGCSVTPGQAETIAATALAWLAGQPERLGVLMAASGLGPADLRARMGEPEFLGFVLDHLLGDEAAVLAFAAEAGLPPDAALRARIALPGAETPHWT
jgi:hypothetical protein